MVKHGMDMCSEPGMSRSPLYVLECDSSPGFAIGRQVTPWIEPRCSSELQQLLCN